MLRGLPWPRSAPWQQHGSGGPIFTVDFAITALRDWRSGTRLALPDPGDHPFLAFCALGNPEAFLADLMLAGVRWVADRTFRDHHAVTPKELRQLQQMAREAEAEALVCTEKDAVKLGALHASGLELPLYVAEQSVVGGEDLLHWVLDRLEAIGRDTATPSGP